ncbi:MAG: hypothetical protein F6K19_04530 [Cyanothece sp. SIO1E1]|nr:hypothetical protein [Cyanothece sp. SIO1E1]
MFKRDSDRQEAFQYRSGQQVALKHCPDTIDTIASYDPMMVPPISLVNDPIPRYPEELELVRSSRVPSNWLHWHKPMHHQVAS